MNRFAISLKGVFENIYEWGEGFKDRETMNKWNTYWNSVFKTIRSLWWKYAEGDSFGGCGHLSSMYGNIYMHPMDFSAVLVMDRGCVSVSIGRDGKKYYNHFGNIVRSLKEICDECAKYCGGSFRLEVSKEFRIEVPEDLSEYKSEHNDNYAELFGDVYEKTGSEY